AQRSQMCARGASGAPCRRRGDCVREMLRAAPRREMSPTPPDDPAGPVRSAGPRRSRRRRRRGGQRATPPAPPLLPTVRGLAGPGPASDVLAPPEIAEMKEHLSFLRRYKEALRLK